MPRAQSDATKIRYLKGELAVQKAQIERLVQNNRDLNLAGSGMSNICYNFSRQSRFTEDERECFRRCYLEWDKVARGWM